MFLNELDSLITNGIRIIKIFFLGWFMFNVLIFTC
ncbi:hypothetical protein KBTX_04510 [wastewater metagenome]|uniref:Uncharacterized protein n=2 Tax=unclassified sequences TaxID=12908 RepID=A0A5B8RJ82_9ZZZZ|nr:hypothetical protein KBTEX_04510 [uncultured organism]